MKKRAIKTINPEIIVFNSAGIKTAQDVRNVILQGAEATGSTSGILNSKTPFEVMEDMIKALKDTWQEVHQNNYDPK
jgi:triosephosphate isomerase